MESFYDIIEEVDRFNVFVIMYQNFLNLKELP